MRSFASLRMTRIFSQALKMTRVFSQVLWVTRFYSQALRMTGIFSQALGITDYIFTISQDDRGFINNLKRQEKGVRDRVQ
jgi:hypothetical protein